MAGKKILLIDADVASRNFVARALQQAQHTVIHAGSGKEGLIYAWRDRPDVIIVEPGLPDLKGEELAAKFRNDPRTANTPLIALGNDSTILRRKQCLDAGFVEYIVKSGQAMNVLLGLLNRLFGMGPGVAEKSGGLLITFLSAKGGTGTSSLCANIAMNIRVVQPEAKTAVLDMVLPIGSIASLVGYKGEQNIVTAADLNPQETTPESFHDMLIEMKDWRFHLLAGSPDPESGNLLKAANIGDIINKLKAAFDYVIIDIGRNLSKISLPIIEHADLVPIILSTDLSTITNTKTTVNYLTQKGVKQTAIFPIMNRAVGLEGLSKPEAEKELGFDIKTAIPFMGSSFSVANNQHAPIALKFPNDSASIVLRDTAKMILEQARKSRNG
jgi:pilus assembly protein CpaE